MVGMYQPFNTPGTHLNRFPEFGSAVEQSEKNTFKYQPYIVRVLWAKKNWLRIDRSRKFHKTGNNILVSIDMWINFKKVGVTFFLSLKWK